MGWLLQNWIWVALGIGAFFMMRRGGFGHYAGGHAGHGHGAYGAQSTRSARPNTPGTTLDPVNGDPVRTDKALTTLYQGTIYYFASSKNRDRFESAPREYARKAAGRRVDVGAAADHQTRRRRGC